MKVRELVEILSKLDPDSDIVLEDQDWDVCWPRIDEIELYMSMTPHSLRYWNGDPGKHIRNTQLVSKPEKAYIIRGEYIYEEPTVLQGDPAVWVDDVGVRPPSAQGRLALPGD